MARKRGNPEQMVLKVRQVELLQKQGVMLAIRCARLYRATGLSPLARAAAQHEQEAAQAVQEACDAESTAATGSLLFDSELRVVVPSLREWMALALNNRTLRLGAVTVTLEGCHP